MTPSQEKVIAIFEKAAQDASRDWSIKTKEEFDVVFIDIIPSTWHQGTIIGTIGKRGKFTFINSDGKPETAKPRLMAEVYIR